MRTKLLILFLFCWSATFGQSVPNNTTFSFFDVATAVYGDHNSGRNLVSAFADATAASFDPNYGSQTMNPKTMLGFRNYGGTWLPIVTTTAITNIAATTATSGGNVTSDGWATVTDRGVCWNTSTNPTTANSHTSDGTGTGNYASSITGLTTGTLYYVRAYATNGLGTAYGNNRTVTPSGPAGVTTAPITNIGSTTATVGGEVTGDGGTPVTSRGVCSYYYPNPTLDSPNVVTPKGSGVGTFVTSISVVLDTRYHVRAYATNSAGTIYGNEQTFITGCLQVPNVNGIMLVSRVGTTVTWDVVYVNSANATEVGVCYNSGGTPTTADSKGYVTISTPLDNNSTVRVVVTGVPAGTHYWRPYAISSCGTGYYGTTGYQY